MACHFRADGWEQHITAAIWSIPTWRKLIGAATSLPDHQIRKYVAIQQGSWRNIWYHSSSIFDNSITNCYSWSISKDGYFIFGGAIQ